MKRGAIVSLDTFTWQMLASVFWPGSFIRCVVNATSTALALGHIDGDIAKAIPTVAGLAAIPFIVKPIDGTIDTAMEMSVSKALNGKIEGPADAGIALGVIGACLAVPPTLFSVAAAIKDVAA
jgi:fission process protein 1